MRDIAFTALIFCLLPIVLKRPWVGALVFIWISVMSPHRYTFGFAYDFPFVAIVAVCTLVGLLLTRDELRYEPNTILLLLIALPLWMCVTYAFGLERENGYLRWIEVMKIFLFIHVTALVLRTRRHIEALLWVMVVSIGFYGIKGGIFTLLSGGTSRVYGPPGESFITDNNAISVALVMVIPLMQYLRGITPSKWLRRGLLAAMVLSGIAVLGSYSRGALLACGAMLFFLFLKSHSKLLFAGMLVLLIPVAISVMPDAWGERMNSIQTYEQDSSAMGRINAWQNAINVANDRPLVGGGFEIYTPQVFARYAPDPEDIHSAHSVYFQMLGEHGYVGLVLFLWIGLAAWATARRTVARASGHPELAWAVQLASAIQVSLVGFAVGGTFVNIAYWEPPYYEILILLVAHRLTRSHRAEAATTAAVGEAAGDPDGLREPALHLPSDRG